MISSTSCTDCPRNCAVRDARSFCGTARPGRVFWRGVTVLEEEPLAPTYEIYFTGCSLRCRFCSMDEAVQRPNEGEWLSPEALAEDIVAGDHPDFRSIAFVGGDPTVNLPYLRKLVPELRSRTPDVPLVFNTHLYVSASRIPEISSWVDVIVGDLHFWRDTCARRVASTADYPDVARRAARGFLEQGKQLILRLLVLPGHLECCARPSIEWVTALCGEFPDQVRLHLMTQYAPLGRARGHRELGRMLTAAERETVRAWVPSSTPSVMRATPQDRLCGGVDPDVPIEVDTEGRVHFPLVTRSVLPLLTALEASRAK